MTKHSNTRLHLVAPSDARWPRRWPQVLDILRLLLYLAVLPLSLLAGGARGLVSFGMWLVETAMRCLFGLLGLLVLASLVFGLGYVLFYPILHR